MVSDESLLRRRLHGGALEGLAPERFGVSDGPSSAELRGLQDRVRKQLYGRVSEEMLRQRRDPAVHRRIEALVRELVDHEAVGLNRMARAALAVELVDDVLGYGPIQSMIDDPEVTEIMVNSPDRVYYEKNGTIRRADNIRFRDDEHVRQLVERIVAPIGRRIDESQPTVDARLPDGSRVHAILPPLALDGVCLNIRKFGRRLSAADLVAAGTVGEEDLAFLAGCVRDKKNIVVSGGTGTGKTTLLNVLSSFIPENERVITIEDSAELQLQQEHVVRLEARPPNVEGKGEVTIRELVRNALRMRPDRIVVGECRGGEALDMLQAMNTGHRGSMTTVHANSAKDAVARLEVMVLFAGQDLPHRAIREQIASAIDLIVHLSRTREGRRRVASICGVRGLDPQGVGVALEVLREYELG